MTRRRVAVFGAGGHGKVVADVAMTSGHEVVAFIDDSPAKRGTAIWDIPVISWSEFTGEAGSWHGAAVGLGVGDNSSRERSVERLRAAGIEVTTLVHATAAVARSARLGAGTVVMAGAAVNPDADVGAGCIVNTGAVVEHDCIVAPFAHLSPNAALGGGVQIGRRTHLGLGAVVLPLVRVGDDVRVGAGAVVHRDVADGLTVAGVPARPLRATSSEAEVESRAALLKRAAAVEAIDLPQDVVEYLARHIQGTDDPERVLVRVAAHAVRRGEAITVPIAQDVLAEFLRKDAK